MRLSPLVLLVPLGAAPALAQTSALAPGDYSHGLTLPPTGAALADQATAPEVNPAGLTYLGDSQLAYLHERNIGKSLLGDGLFLSDTFFDFLGASVSVQWLRGTQIPAYRKTTWALSLGVQELSFGAAFNFFSAHGSDLDGLSGIDLGLMSRPARFLSLAAVIKNVDSLSQGSVAFERRYDLGIGLRPIGERYTLGVDYLWGDNAGPSGGRMSYALQAEVLNGVSLGAGLSHGFNNSGDVLFQLSATINTPHVGATYALGDSPGTPGDSFSGLDHVVEVRVSRDKYRALAVNDGKIALFDLAELLSGSATTGQTLFGLTAEDPYLRATHMLDQASRDPRLNAVVLKLDALPGGLGHMDELRDAVIRLRASGKRVIAVLLNCGDSEYLVASAADKIYAVPQAMLDINGFVANVEFLGGTMDWLGVDWDVARVGAFKNAPDQLTRTEMSTEQKEAINAYLDVDVKHFDQALAQTRQLSQEKVRTAWKEGVVTPQRAKELGLIDDVVGSEELNTKLEELVPGARFDPHYAPGDVREARWGDKRKIAIVPVVGDIAGGKNGEDPFGLQRVAGAASVVRSLKAAVEDNEVAAIVLRVDSPGGDGLASDLIYREVLEAKKKKPVIASMGDVAASGGYYVAMGAEEIWAEPTTITGSIGVFLVKPAFERLGNKIHLRRDSVERGEMADFFGVYRPWTDAEKRAAQGWVNAFYDAFITEVGKSRHLEKGAVDKIAQGRVWAGADAKERGLVDNLGGLLQAIDAARNKAHVPASEDMEVEVFTDRKGLLSVLGVGARVREWLGDDSATARLPEGVRTLARELGLADAALMTPGLKAAMPFHLSVH